MVAELKIESEITSVKPLRALSALDVSRALGWSKREVLLWASDEQHPHTLGLRAGKLSPSFNLEEVTTFRRERGLSVFKPNSDAQRGSVPEKPSDVLWTGLMAELVGPVDYDQLIARAKVAFARLLADMEKGTFFADEQQKLASAFKSASGELRQLEEARFQHQQRAGEWVSRRTCAAILSSEAAAFGTDLSTIVTDIPVKVRERMLGTASDADLDKFTRVVSVVVREVVDATRQRRATSIRQQANLIDRAAREAGVGA